MCMDCWNGGGIGQHLADFLAVELGGHHVDQFIDLLDALVHHVDVFVIDNAFGLGHRGGHTVFEDGEVADNPCS